jgi:hypothetical protein
MKKLVVSAALVALVSFCTLAGAQSVSKEEFAAAVKTFNTAYAKAKPTKLAITGTIIYSKEASGKAAPLLQLNVNQDGYALITPMMKGKLSSNISLVPINGVQEATKLSYTTSAIVLTRTPKGKGTAWDQLEIKFMTRNQKQRTRIIVAPKP